MFSNVHLTKKYLFVLTVGCSISEFLIQRYEWSLLELLVKKGRFLIVLLIFFVMHVLFLKVS